MHNEQILPLFCGSAFCAEGVGARQRCGSGRSGRYGSERSGALWVALHVEVQA